MSEKLSDFGSLCGHAWGQNQGPNDPDNGNFTLPDNGRGCALAHTRPSMLHMTRTNFYFPPQMIERLKQAKTLSGIPMSEFIRRAIDAALKELGL